MQLAMDTNASTHYDSQDNESRNKKVQAHIIRRNLEKYLEQKALERRVKDVFDDYDYDLDD